MNRYRLHMKDGFSMSVQASTNHYSVPRENLARLSVYSAVEVGFPNEAEPLLLPYQESKGDPTEDVYPYVPIEVVQEVIEKHGGLVL